MLGFTLLVFTVSTGLVQAADTVKSKDGTVEYNCPAVQSIENFYAGACLSSIGRTTQLTYSLSQAAYDQAPTDYTVASGAYTLDCQYGDIFDNIAECHYTGGTGQSLTLEDGYNNDEGCPHDLNTGPQPSKRAVLVCTSETIECPHDSNRIDTYVRGGDDSTSFSDGSVADNYYVCYIKPPTTAQGDSVFCYYRPNGILADSYDALYPAKLCAVATSSNRVSRRGIYIGDSPIHARQVNTTLLRQSGRKRVQE